MMNIPCPYCGPRNEGEFAFGGPVKPDRPIRMPCPKKIGSPI